MNATIQSESGRVRRLLYYVVAVVAVVTGVFVFWWAFFGTLMPRRFMANLVLGGSVFVYYFQDIYERFEADTRLDRRSWAVIAWSGALGVAGVVATTYVVFSYDRWLENQALLVYSTSDLIVGAAVMIIVLEMTFRSFGKALGLAVVVALAYGLWGSHLPGVFAHSGLDVPTLIARQTVVLDGVYGTLLQIAATWVAIFLLFAGFVESYGGFEFVRRLARRVALVSRSGIAQAAVVASMFVGMMTGGAAVNVALSGSFTIPMMKDHNLPPRIAGAIESLASTGGQILPPIMGLVAFIIADFLGVRYVDVIVAGTIPALLFYFVVAVAVHVLVLSSGWVPDISAEDFLDADHTRGVVFLLQGAQYVVPLALLLYLLAVVQLPIMLSGGYTIVTLVALRFLYVFNPLTVEPITLARLGSYLEHTIEGFRLGVIKLAPFAGLLAALGMMTNVLSFSGLGQRLGLQLVLLGGGSFIAVLLLAMFVSLLFGLGMPTPAAYLIVAVVLAPALIEIGIADMTAHLFVFYFALLSAITPPVAIAVAVASEIAESDFLETAKWTLVMGGPVFLIPFLFVAHPSLITWAFPAVAYDVLLSATGLLVLVFALTGSNGTHDYGRVERAVLIVACPVVSFAPSLTIRAAAALVALAIAFRLSISRRLPLSAEERA